MDNYQRMKEELEKTSLKLDVANNKSLELDNISNDIKELVNSLKPTITSKDKYILKQEDKEKINFYIFSVSKTNEEFKKINKLSVILNDVDTELKENREKVKILTENNNALLLRVETLNKNLENKQEEIKELKEENNTLRNSLEFWKDKFLRVIRFIKSKMFNKKDKDKYFDVSVGLYNRDLIDKETFS